MTENQSHVRKLLTVITESALESSLTRDLEKQGARGYTISDVRGKGDRGVRDAGWEASSNIRIDVVCEEAVGRRIAGYLKERYYANFAMIVMMSDVEVLRPEKF